MSLLNILKESVDNKSLLDYLGYYPDDDEVIWEYISECDFKNEHIEPPKKMNVSELYHSLNVAGGYEKYKYSIKDMDSESKQKIEDMRKNITEYADDPIIIFDDELLDGYHRLYAMFKEEIEWVNVLDIQTIDSVL